jgi:hypothetical protein
MGMRKIFRMQYEPCNGTCYAWEDDWEDDDDSGPRGGGSSSDGDSDILPLRALRFDQVRLKSIMTKLVAMHQELCGNKNLRYGIDLDEDNGLFIGSFWHYGKLELFTETCHLRLIEKMAEFVLEFYKTDAYFEESKHDKGVGHSVCEHGEDDDLRRFIIRTSKIPTPHGVDAYLQEMGFAV